MPPRILPLTSGNAYHIYNRGVNKDPIFLEDCHYSMFLFRLREHIQDKAEVIAYCLMPNHFHLLLQISSEGFVNSALQPFLVSYAKAFSNQIGRVGPLFQGRYKANLIHDDTYLLDCVKYIHLNPVKAGLVINPVQWTYSSYRDYVNVKKSTFVNTSTVMQFFDSQEEFRDHTEIGMEEYGSKYFKDFS